MFVLYFNGIMEPITGILDEGIVAESALKDRIEPGLDRVHNVTYRDVSDITMSFKFNTKNVTGIMVFDSNAVALPQQSGTGTDASEFYQYAENLRNASR